MFKKYYESIIVRYFKKEKNINNKVEQDLIFILVEVNLFIGSMLFELYQCIYIWYIII